MLAMGSDRPHHGHPQRSGPAPFPTLPPFAELFSSSSSAAPSMSTPPPPPPTTTTTTPDSLPPYHRHGHSASLLHSMPPSAPALNAPAKSERPSWLPENHPSPRDSFAESSVPAMAPARHYSHRYQAPQPAVPHSSVLTSEVCQNLQDSALSQTPINAPRQDSAVHPSPDFPFSSFSARSPKTGHRQYSPRPNSHSSTQSSPVLPPAIPQPHHMDLQPASLHSQQAQQNSHSSTPRNSSVPFSGSHEHPGDQAALVDIRPLAKSMGPAATYDQANGSSTTTTTTTTTNNNHNNHNNNNNNNANTATTPPARQGRYNVRFATNYTSENIPSAQKNRQDPAPVVVADPSSPAPVPNDQPSTSQQQQQQHQQHQQQPAPTEEPSIQVFNASLQTPDTSQNPQSRPREGDSSVERCQGCNEAWRRPLPDIEQFRRVSPAETGLELSMTSHNLIAQLRDHRLKADAAYEQWKWHHSHCVVRENYAQPTSPCSNPSPEDSYGTDVDKAAENGKQAEAVSKKRKSDVLDDQDHATTSKLRKVTFEGRSVAPPVRPSAPA